MSEQEGQDRQVLIAEKGDLVICLDTGSVGIILECRTLNTYLVSFPHGSFEYEWEDFDVLKTG